MKQKLFRLLKSFPPIRKCHHHFAELKACLQARSKLFAPPGHFYSPIPSLEEVTAREETIFAVPESIPAIDLNVQGQHEILHALAQYYPLVPFTPDATPEYRYYYHNDQYSYADAIILFCMLHHLRPKRVIEIGSGYSSCVMLDTNERFLNRQIALSFIEPYPDRLLSLKRSEEDIHHLKACPLQDVPLDTFTALQAGDILFIDSTHVAKIGSDVNYLIFHILPALNPGVFIHIHDIFYPFEYPREWVYQGRGWNEAYLLRAFLEHNEAFRIIFFYDYLLKCHRALLEEKMPLCLRNPGGNIWLKKMA